MTKHSILLRPFLVALAIVVPVSLARTSGVPSFQAADAAGSGSATKDPRFPQVARADDTSTTSLTWRYRVQVEDAALGIVNGEATVDMRRGVRVRLFDPRDGRPYELHGGPPVWSDGELVIELAGASPCASEDERLPASVDSTLARARAHPPTDTGAAADARAAAELFELATRPLPEIALEGPTDALRLTVEGFERSVRVGPAAHADVDRLTLRLAPRQDGALIGTWSYRTDPRSARDGAGAGRLGALRVDPDAAGVLLQQGAERWLPLVEIHAAFAPNDQAARLGDVALDDFGPATTRWVFVVGANLPRRLADVREVVALDHEAGAPHIGYRVAYHDAWAGQNEIYDRDLERGWAIARELGAIEPGRANAVLLEARIPAGTPPGRQRFVLNGAVGAWSLVYGDELGVLTLAHADTPADRPEHVDTLCVPGEVQVRLHTALELPFATLDVRLARRDRHGELLDERVVVLTPNGDDPRLLESGVIAVWRADLLDESPAAATPALGLRARDDDRLELTLVDPAQVLLPAARVVTHVAVPAAGSEGLWRETLARVLTMHGLAWSDWNTLQRKTAGFVDNLSFIDAVEVLARATNPVTALTNAVGLTLDGLSIQPSPRVLAALGGRPPTREKDVIRSLSISAGDQAAMLLLRDTFVDLCDAQSAALRALTPAQRSARFERTLRSLVREPDSAWAIFAIDAPDGAETLALSLVFDDGEMARRGLRDEALRALRRHAVEKALKAYTGDLDRAAKHAVAIDDHDLRELLELTGFEFRPVVEALLPRLASFEDGLWRPDRVARSRVESLYVLAQAARDQQALADADTLFFVRIGAVMTIPLWSAGGAYAVAAAALETGAAGAEAGRAAAAWSAARDALTFARAAEPVLGPGRRQRAELEESRTFQMLMWAVSSAAAVGCVDAALLHEIGRAAVVSEAVADDLVDAVARGGLDALQEMPHAQRTIALDRMVALDLDQGARHSRTASTRAIEARDRLAADLRQHLASLEGVPYHPLDAALGSTGPRPGPLDVSYARLRDGSYYEDASGAIVRRGRPVSNGGFAFVYALASRPGGPEDSVVKLLVSDQLPTRAHAEEVLRGVERGARILSDKKVPQLDLDSIVDDAAIPYVTQRAIDRRRPTGVSREWLAESDDSYRTLRAGDSIDRRAPAPLRNEVGEAVLDLLVSIHQGQRPAVWMDPSLRNIVLQTVETREGPRLRAAVLDQDQIEWWDTLRRGTGDGAEFLPANEVERLLAGFRTGRLTLPSMESGGAIASAEECLVRTLERCGYIRYDAQRGWVDGMLPVAAVRNRIRRLDDYLP